MENKDISQIALEKIKENGIKPISKNVFNFKRVFFWSIVGISIVIGAVSFSITLAILFGNDWYLYNKFGFGFILKTLPYFWVACLLLFTILGEFYYRKTLLGYRHRITVIVGVYIALTVISGSVLHLFRIGEAVEQSLFENVPIYHIFIFDRDGLWSQPEEGLLSGKIIEIGENVIKIVGCNNTPWTINTNNVFVDKQTKIEIGKIIKVVRDKDYNNIFTAEGIYPTGNGLKRGCSMVR